MCVVRTAVHMQSPVITLWLQYAFISHVSSPFKLGDITYIGSLFLIKTKMTIIYSIVLLLCKIKVFSS